MLKSKALTQCPDDAQRIQNGVNQPRNQRNEGEKQENNNA